MGTTHIGVYAISGATSSAMLQNLLVREIIALQSVWAIVSNLNCDGYQTNKGLHILFGISGKMNEVKNYIEHPTEPNQKTYFMFDPPHIFKSTRNYMMNNKDFQVSKHLFKN